MIQQLYYFNKALTIEAYASLEDNQALTLMNVGSIYIEQGKYNLALAQLLNANKTFEKYNNNFNLAVNERLIARALRMLGLYDEVPLHLELAKASAHKINTSIRVLEIYEEYINYYSDIRNLDSTLAYFNRYRTLSDSVFSIEKLIDIQDVKAKYENETRENELKLKEQSIAILKSQRIINRLIILVLAIFICATTILLIFIKNRSRKKQLLAEKEKTLQKNNP